MHWVTATISGRYLGFVGMNGVGDIRGDDEVSVGDGGVRDNDFVKI